MYVHIIHLICKTTRGSGVLYVLIQKSNRPVLNIDRNNLCLGINSFFNESIDEPSSAIILMYPFCNASERSFAIYFASFCGTLSIKTNRCRSILRSVWNSRWPVVDVNKKTRNVWFIALDCRCGQNRISHGRFSID